MNFYTGTDTEIVMMPREAGKLGRLPAHPEETHPRLTLEDYADFTQLPAPPELIDYCSKVAVWPMYLNDQLGDCTCAAVGHQIQAFTAYGNTEVDVTDDNVLSLYEAMGYVPGDPSTDNGAVIQDVLQYVAADGIAGHKYLIFAQMKNLKNMTQIYQALDLFGSVYLGINIPQSAVNQFNAHEPWTDTGDTDILGGHAIVVQKKNADSSLDVITWGSVQQMDQSFWNAYVEEAWVVISPDWINAASGQSPTGLNLAALQADFKAL